MIKSNRQDDYELNPNMGSYLYENDSQGNFEVKQIQTVDLQIEAEEDKSLLKPSEQSEYYNLPSNPTRAQNELNFITLGRISEDHKSN